MFFAPALVPSGVKQPQDLAPSEILKVRVRPFPFSTMDTNRQLFSNSAEADPRLGSAFRSFTGTASESSIAVVTLSTGLNRTLA